MTVEGVGIVCDTSAFKKMAANWRLASPAAYKAAQRVLRGVALEVAADAKGRSQFSKRISGSIKVRMAGLGAKVSAGGGSAYFAVPCENRGAGFILHPVFGNLNGQQSTAKNSHAAFLRPSFEPKVAAYIEALRAVVVEATQEALSESV